MTLIESLKSFKGAATMDELTGLFRELAPAIIYGGHIRVGEDYRIYIRLSSIFTLRRVHLMIFRIL